MRDNETTLENWNKNLPSDQESLEMIQVIKLYQHTSNLFQLIKILYDNDNVTSDSVNSFKNIAPYMELSILEVFVLILGSKSIKLNKNPGQNLRVT